MNGDCNCQDLSAATCLRCGYKFGLPTVRISLFYPFAQAVKKVWRRVVLLSRMHLACQKLARIILSCRWRPFVGISIGLCALSHYIYTSLYSFARARCTPQRIRQSGMYRAVSLLPCRKALNRTYVRRAWIVSLLGQT